MLSLLGKRDEALENIEKLLTNSPQLAEAHHTRGHILDEKGNIEEAKKSFINSINYDPLNAHHFYCIGIFILKTYHNSKSALEEAKEAFETSMNLGDQKNQQICQKYIQEIDRRIKKYGS